MLYGSQNFLHGQFTQAPPPYSVMWGRISDLDSIIRHIDLGPVRNVPTDTSVISHVLGKEIHDEKLTER